MEGRAGFNKEMSMLLKRLTLENFLSFGKKVSIPLRDINIFIGANGSGKSNVLDAIELLHSAPKNISSPMREGGGTPEWIWKGTGEGYNSNTAVVEAIVHYPYGTVEGNRNIRYMFSFSSPNMLFEQRDEVIENEAPINENEEIPYFYYHYNNGRPVINVDNGNRSLKREDVDFESSILSQRKDPDVYPEITYIGSQLEAIRLYRKWNFGRKTPARSPERTDAQNRYLEADYSNWILVLNRLSNNMHTKRKIEGYLKDLKAGITGYNMYVSQGTIQFFLEENGVSIPSARLSDGTIHFLCLLTMLCDPTPPPVICIEEPEIGLHPDMISKVADLIMEASKVCQIIVSTHSPFLVDYFTDTPEDVVVVENNDGSSYMSRLSKAELLPWLEKYSLGDLWVKGEIGGTVW